MMTPREKFWVDIDIAALRRNIRRVQQHIGASRQIIFVVKSDGYGHGAVEAARAALAEGVDTLGVATLAEGLILRRAGISENIVLLQPSLDDELEEAIAAGLQLSISDLDTARRVSSRTFGRPVKVHVELNTGMNRMGFNPQEAVTDIPQIAALPDIHLAGIFTHFRPTASGANGEVTRQIRLFNSIIDTLRQRGVAIPRLHAASSLSVVHYPEAHFDLVRPGLLLYGGFNGSMSVGEPRTEPVMSCHCRVLFTRRVQQGEWVHYGDTFQVPRPMNLAVIAAGYGAGYPKSLSNSGEVLIAGMRAGICGVVGMDMTIVDISALPSCTQGDVVTLLGRDGNDEITVGELAARAQTIPYEILCRLGRNLPRYYSYPEILPQGSAKRRTTVAVSAISHSE
jgi:alanine racemase